MSNEIQTNRGFLSDDVLEKVLVGGDLSKLSSPERLSYIRHVCESIGINPLTRPFEFIQLNGKLTLYARKDATDQIRSVKGVSITNVKTEKIADTYLVTVSAEDKTGRKDVDLGVVSIGNLKGDALANALMKAITKAKRRVTLSLCGLGMLDETELETIPELKAIKSSILLTNQDNSKNNGIQKIEGLSSIDGSLINPVILASSGQIAEFWELVEKINLENDTLKKWLERAGVETFEEMEESKLLSCIEHLKSKLGEANAIHAKD